MNFLFSFFFAFPVCCLGFVGVVNKYNSEKIQIENRKIYQQQQKNKKYSWKNSFVFYIFCCRFIFLSFSLPFHPSTIFPVLYLTFFPSRRLIFFCARLLLYTRDLKVQLFSVHWVVVFIKAKQKKMRFVNVYERILARHSSPSTSS